jgi:hypothetical protein
VPALVLVEPAPGLDPCDEHLRRSTSRLTRWQGGEIGNGSHRQAHLVGAAPAAARRIEVDEAAVLGVLQSVRTDIELG